MFFKSIITYFFSFVKKLLYSIGIFPGYKIPFKSGLIKTKIMAGNEKLNIDGFYLSIKGERKKEIPVNQDSFFFDSNNKVFSITVADGLGSRKLSHIGAEELTKRLAKSLTEELKESKL